MRINFYKEFNIYRLQKLKKPAIFKVMKRRVTLLITFSLCLSFRLFPQLTKRVIPALDWKDHFNKTQQLIFSVPQNLMGFGFNSYNVRQPEFKYSLKPFQYEAFFCRLEEKNRTRLGFFVKFHAGDYELYTKRK